MGRQRVSIAAMQLSLLQRRPAAHPVVADTSGHGNALEELGPILPPRGAVHAQALELLALAKRAEEFSGTGPTADLALALRQLDHMRAILGGAG